MTKPCISLLVATLLLLVAELLHKILMSIIQTARKNNINPLHILISLATKSNNLSLPSLKMQ